MKKSYWKIHVSSSWVVFTITSLKHEPFYFYYSRSVEHSYILNYKLNTVSKRQIRLLLNRQAVKGGWWAAALAPVLKEDWTRREGFLACGGKIVSCRIFMGICKGMACLCASACQFVCIYSFFSPLLSEALPLDLTLPPWLWWCYSCRMRESVGLWFHCLEGLLQARTLSVGDKKDWHSLLTDHSDTLVSLRFVLCKL